MHSPCHPTSWDPFFWHLQPSLPSRPSFHPACRLLGLLVVWCVLRSSLLVMVKSRGGGYPEETVVENTEAFLLSPSEIVFSEADRNTHTKQDENYKR